MSERTVKRRKIGRVRYRGYIVSKEGESWSVEQWRAGKAVLELSEGTLSFAFDHQDVGVLLSSDARDILEIFKAAEER